MQPHTGAGIGLFVLVSDTVNGRQAICLYNSETDSANIGKMNAAKREKIQKIYRGFYGIRIVKKGIYKTACGKGFFDCIQGEPEQIKLLYPGINFFPYDAGFEKCYYWDSKENKFLSQQTGD